MKTYTYTVRIHKADPDETGFWAEVPSLPGCFTQGETYEETLGLAHEAIQLYLEGLVQEGLPIPETIVPMHGGDLKRGTLHGILKDAGLTEEELRDLL